MESHSILLQEDNYAEWSARMASNLNRINLWSVVMSPEAYEEEDVQVSSGDWERKNSSALSLIRGSCGDEAKFEIRECTSGSDAWNILAKKFTMLNSTSKDNEGYSTLAQAIIRGERHMVKSMLRKDKNLIILENTKRCIPVVLAIDHGNENMAHYLYDLTPLKHLIEYQGIHGATVCTHAIYNGMLGIALHLMKRHQPLSLAVDVDGSSPLYALASTYNAFLCVPRPMFWDRWICFIYYHSFSALFNRSVEHLEDKNSFNLACELLDLMCHQISISNDDERKSGLVYASINHAIEEGMFDFICKILKRSYVLKWPVDPNGRTILSNAVLHRRAKIFREILKSVEKDVMIHSVDNEKNNILHMAGMLGPNTRLDFISGAALQMQNELQWFKEVERFVPPAMTDSPNKDGLTPQELFIKSHMGLWEKEEKWIRSTTTFCSLMGALISSITFAAVVSVPGGYDRETGLPVFLNEKAFKLFMVCDFISFLFSSTSVLVFLGILTSQYAEKDFLKSLPKRMIIGLLTLFFSIATMMIAFCTALIKLQGRSSNFTRVICLASLPFVLFLARLRLFIDIYKSNYGSSIWM